MEQDFSQEVASTPTDWKLIRGCESHSTSVLISKTALLSYSSQNLGITSQKLLQKCQGTGAKKV